MKWNSFQTKKPKHNKPFLFFNHRARLQFGCYKKWEYSESDYFEDRHFLSGYYEILNGEGSRFYLDLEEVKNQNLIQYWCYFSENGLGEMHVDIIGHVDLMSHDQSPKNVEEDYESYTGASWELRFKKMCTPNDEYRKEKD